MLQESPTDSSVRAVGHSERGVFPRLHRVKVGLNTFILQVSKTFRENVGLNRHDIAIVRLCTSARRANHLACGKTCPAPSRKNIPLCFLPKSVCVFRAVPPDERGRCARHETRGLGCDGRGVCERRSQALATRSSCGPDAPMAGVKVLEKLTLLGGDGDKQAWSHRGEHGISRKTIAQGRPDCFR